MLIPLAHNGVDLDNLVRLTTLKKILLTFVWLPFINVVAYLNILQVPSLFGTIATSKKYTQSINIGSGFQVKRKPTYIFTIVNQFNNPLILMQSFKKILVTFPARNVV
ncbi:MAG: hypothetical protein EBR27_13650 [Betaproteobacteria bacterium]|nr:hypothetical protein [Betaproteobacteria bacterium]